ncbi:Cobaltochelatase CobN subunit [Methanothrix harundinacea 6Ac]|uniref:Cobaltochelatase CobN subunit n=2 Tax=Methanothrix harundinacea TaxID=301375 RepID=G7WNW1_METH6|nr:Cobaltochelatase CobN subunit [Methanothrix harundinacea 6Ac]
MRISPLILLILMTIVPALGDLSQGPSEGEAKDEPSDLIWEGELLLAGGEIPISGGSGNASIAERSALGALIRASEAGGFELLVDLSLWAIRGPVVVSMGGADATANRTWRYVVNYPQDPVPVVGPDQFLLKEGDEITFFLGDRHALPGESPRVNITARILTERPEALFIAAENHAGIEESAKDAVLNVTLAFVETAPSNLSGYDLIFLEMVGSDGARKLLPLLEAPKEAGVPVISIHSEGYDGLLGDVDLQDHPEVEEYWNYGGVENMKGLYSYLARAFLGLEVPVRAPVPTPRAYISHPDSPDLFLQTSSYLQWYRSHSGHRYDELAPTIGVMNLASDPVTSSMRTAIVRALEARGANVIDIGFENTTTIQDFFILNGSTIVDAVLLTKPFRLNYGDPEEGIEALKELNVPVLNAMKLWYQTPEEWRNETGLFPAELYFKIAMPEMDAVIEPMMIAGRTEKGTFDPVQSQIDWLADRAIAWAELGRRPNSEKKAAIIYYNHGGGKDNLGATYINVPRSLRVILQGLNGSGYRVEGTVPDEQDLVDLMAHQGTNVGTWAPEELEKMVRAGNATLIPADDYLEWFSEIDPAKQREVTEIWGPPPGEIMVYENESGSYFVIPKLSFGNVILAPQPTRGWLQNSTILYHNKDIPPHHQYIAFYLWLRRGFDADFIVHLGKHGTQEWTPGKESGISRDQCWPGILIQDLPVIYPYIVDNIAEGSQAKRRGDAVIITHLTPPIVASGLYGNFTHLAETAFNYHQVENASVKALYKEEIIARCEELHLDEDLDKNLSELSRDPEAFDGFVEELEHYLYDLKKEFMPYGLHTFATPPEGGARLEMVQSMLGDDYKREVALMISYDDYPNPSRLDKERELDNASLALLAAVIDDKTSPDLAQGEVFSNRPGAGTANRSENLTALLALALSRSEGLDASVEEVPRFINASESEYTPPSPADDPIRDPNVLPTGRNFHSISPRMVPTPAAWEVGSELAEDLIEVYRAEENGTYPRKLAIVLWAWATTDHGVVEAEILRLVGAEPVWDSYGGVSDVRLTPSSELGRPRIDVVVVPSGLHRDLFPEKLQLIDRAIRLAANDSATDYPNYVRENSEEIRSELLATGNYSEEDAEFLAASRIFLEAAGTYGPNLDSPVSASDTWENDSKLGDLFIDRMSYIYGDGVWGSRTPSGKDYAAVQTEVYRRNLAEVEAAAHHTNSNLYGFIDNDDVYQYLGGISMAVRTVTGVAPNLYVTDARARGAAGKAEPLKSFFTRELRSRYYNPKWIEGMKGEGYSGGREMDKFVEHLWGWDVTVPDLVTETMWNEAYDVYVKDKYDMGLREFFDEKNPYAYQVVTARMLEASRKGYWHPTEEMKKKLAEEFEESETEFGVTCCHHTCGNILLREYLEGVLTGTEQTEATRDSASKGGGSSRHPYPRAEAPGAANATRPPSVGTEILEELVPAGEAAGSVQDDVSGLVMEELAEESPLPSRSAAPLMGIILVLFILLAVGAGFLRRW